MWLVEYELGPDEVFDGFGGYTGKNNKLIGLANSLKSNYRVLTRNGEYTDDDVFPLFYAYYLSHNKTPLWNSDGSITIPDTLDLNFIKRVKIFELKSYVSNLLAQIDWIIIKLYGMQLEGFSADEVNAEKTKYSDRLSLRKKIRQWNKSMEDAINKASSVNELLSLSLEFKP